MTSVKEKNTFDTPSEVREFVTPLLHMGEVEISFIKANGEDRTMIATLKESALPKVVSDKPVKARKHSDEVMAVWSVHDKGWRSFRLDSVIGIKFSILDGD